MVDPNGNMRLRVTGRSRGEYAERHRDAAPAQLHRLHLLHRLRDARPGRVLQPGHGRRQRCSRYRAGRAGRGCTEIQFTDNDDVFGPFHTNDNVLICGTPTFGRTVRDVIEVNGPP